MNEAMLWKEEGGRGERGGWAESEHRKLQQRAFRALVPELETFSLKLIM